MQDDTPQPDVQPEAMAPQLGVIGDPDPPGAGAEPTPEDFQRLAENMPTLCWMAHRDGSIFWYNRRWYDYTGTTPEQMTGWGWRSVHDPQVLPSVMERWTTALAREAPFEMTFPLRGADGVFRPFLTRIHPCHNAEGAVVRWFGVNTDVSAQVAAEQALQTSEARLRALTDNLPGAAVYQLETSRDMSEREVTYLSANYERLTGISTEDARERAKRARMEVSPEELERALAADRAAGLAVAPIDHEVAARRPDGGLIVLRIISSPRLISEDRLAWDGVLLDVTAQKQVEAELRASEERMRIALGSGGLGVWSVDQATGQVFLSDEAAAMFGVQPTPGMTWIELQDRCVYPDDAERIRDAARAALESGEDYAEEFRVRRDDGDGWVAAFGRPTYGPDRQRSGITGVVRDITERRLAEIALRDLNATLETRVEERTRDLVEAQEALRQAQKMEAVGQLTGGVAHDFNNLLTIIIGNLDLLRRRLPDDAGRVQYLADNALQGARRAATLTQRLLAFARRQPLQPKPLSVNQVVMGMSDMLSRALGEQVDVQTVLSGGLWTVEADVAELESALLNLAVNARDAMPGGGKLTIETANAHLDEHYASHQAEVAPGYYVMVSVSDTGTGMPKEVLDRVFEPFFTTKEVGQGTGLGLSQVYGFVKQSGGHVKAYSEVGEGTSLKIYLPRLSGQAEPVAEVREPLVPQGAGDETVLVVEDDHDVRAFSVAVLLELGYRVLEAPDGPAALRLLESGQRVDVLFTDVVLPGGMTGRDLADAVLPTRPGLKVLYTSGYSRNAIVHQGRLDAGVQLIGKPFTAADLASRLRALLDG
jgi:PAS domain S-box-containing protein